MIKTAEQKPSTSEGWHQILKKDLPMYGFYLYLGQGLGIPVDIYATNESLVYPLGRGERDHLGHVWAHGKQFMSWLFPQREWTESEVNSMSTYLWGRWHNTTRNVTGIFEKESSVLPPNVGLVRTASYDMGHREEHSGDGTLVPVSPTSVARIISYVRDRHKIEPSDQATLLTQVEDLKDQLEASKAEARKLSEGEAEKNAQISDLSVELEQAKKKLNLIISFAIFAAAPIVFFLGAMSF